MDKRIYKQLEGKEVEVDEILAARRARPIIETHSWGTGKSIGTGATKLAIIEAAKRLFRVHHQHHAKYDHEQRPNLIEDSVAFRAGLGETLCYGCSSPSLREM